jgi:hypothetical protein
MRGNVLKLALNFIRVVCKKLEKLPPNGFGYRLFVDTYGNIVADDLNITGMVKNHHFAIGGGSHDESQHSVRTFR